MNKSQIVWIAVVLLSWSEWGHGSREIANWHVSDFVQEAPSGFTIYSVHPMSTGNTLDDLWACGLENGKSAIYHYHDGQWRKSDPVPHIGDLGDIVMVSPDSLTGVLYRRYSLAQSGSILRACFHSI